MPKRRRPKHFSWSRLLVASLLVLLAFIPLRLAIARHQSPEPQAILMLGGGAGRETFTAQFARTVPDLPIWLSSGAPPEAAQAIFQTAGITESRLILDYRAADTVTNFTTLVQDFEAREIQHLYLITSDFHMPRARAIATLVLGSRGIVVTPVTVPSNQPNEALWRILRDCGRSLLWIATGRTGASLGR